jgi:hypothetical protein
VIPIPQSECEGSGSYASSEDVEVVGVGVCMQVTGAAAPAVRPDKLFQSHSTRSLSSAMSAGTSVFSYQTRRRWELAEEEIWRTGGDHVAHAGGMFLQQSWR